MTDPDLVSRYNYAVFARENFGPWLRFEESPPLGEEAPDFPLWHLDGTETRLSEVWSQHRFTVVEFGSLT